jgi:hypothetical protein
MNYEVESRGYLRFGRSEQLEAATTIALAAVVAAEDKAPVFH